MKKFDIADKIGKKMPYKAPSEEFFATFKSEMMERVAQEEKKTAGRTMSLRLFIPMFAAAASLLIGLFVVDKIEFNPSRDDMSYLVSDNLDASIDSYFNSLSDDELAYLLDNTSSQDDFYSTLPTNE
ncbi:MAG: hypothetical protein SNH35_00475 [Rikenellaceae bacterium]